MKWEYLAIKLHSVDANGVVLDDKKLTQELNRLGVQGLGANDRANAYECRFQNLYFQKGHETVIMDALGIAYKVTVGVLPKAIQWAKCKRGHTFDTRWQSAKPSTEWLGKHGYYIVGGKGSNSPVGHEEWMVQCLRCDKPIQGGSNGGMMYL